MENIKNHPAPDQLDSFDKYPPYYGQDLELAYTPQRSVFTLWAPPPSTTPPPDIPRLPVHGSSLETWHHKGGIPTAAP